MSLFDRKLPSSIAALPSQHAHGCWRFASTCACLSSVASCPLQSQRFRRSMRKVVDVSLLHVHASLRSQAALFNRSASVAACARLLARRFYMCMSLFDRKLPSSIAALPSQHAQGCWRFASTCACLSSTASCPLQSQGFRRNMRKVVGVSLLHVHVSLRPQAALFNRSASVTACARLLAFRFYMCMSLFDRRLPSSIAALPTQHAQGCWRFASTCACLSSTAGCPLQSQ